MDQSKQHIIACATVMEEMRPLIPEGLTHTVFDFGLHITPKKLHNTLQEAIDRADAQYETIFLGYGLCSLAIAGISARHCTLVIPRVDDCIAIFLGSRDAYLTQFNQQPGTYYLTKGWMEIGDTPFREYDRTLETHGKERADLVYEMMMAQYTRLVFIHTNASDTDSSRNYARTTAARFGLAYEEIQGSDRLIRKMLFGPWDKELVVVQPGESVTMEQFILMDA
jgi:hypothetical protein